MMLFALVAPLVIAKRFHPDCSVSKSNLLNDNYCDCIDGTDEPDTGACDHTFTCVNIGHVSTSIRSMFFNDSIQDCCDCSDEPLLKTCKNNCKVLAQESRIFRERDHKHYLKKKGAIKKGLGFRNSKDKELRALKAKQVNLESSLPIFQAIVDNQMIVPSITFKEQELINALISMSRSATERLKVLDLYYKRALERSGQRINLIDNNEIENKEIDDEDTDSVDNETSDAKTDAKTENETEDNSKEETLSEYNLEESIPKNLVYILGQDPVDPKEIPLKTLCDSESDSFMDCLKEAIKMNVNNLSSIMKWNGFKKLKDEFFSYFGSSTSISNAKSQLEKIKSQQSINQPAIDKMEQLLGKQYGPNNDWIVLHDKCIEKKVFEYTYRLCFFEKAVQIDRHGSETSLGTFEAFVDGRMKYSGGAGCWNGPDRTSIVEMVCGEEEIISVEEMTKCEYVFTIKTIFACNDNDKRNHPEL